MCFLANPSIVSNLFTDIFTNQFCEHLSAALHAISAVALELQQRVRHPNAPVPSTAGHPGTCHIYIKCHRPIYLYIYIYIVLNPDVFFG